MTYVKGKDLALVAGKVGDFYIAILADADAKLGPLFMEFNRRKNEIAKILEQYFPRYTPQGSYRLFV
jgi:predicted regulator of Ras-like GTPase activity (Roadblock/LC7/MglB family)